MCVKLHWFKYSDFDSPDYPGSGDQMSDRLLLLLDIARDIAEIPFIVNSGFRSIEHNKKVGGSSTSSHLGGLAVDIAYKRPRDAARIIAALTQVGIRRIGLGKTFVHADIDPDKVSPAYWDYT